MKNLIFYITRWTINEFNTNKYLDAFEYAILVLLFIFGLIFDMFLLPFAIILSLIVRG